MIKHINRYDLKEIKTIRLSNASEGNRVVEIKNLADVYKTEFQALEYNQRDQEQIRDLFEVLKDLQKNKYITIELDFEEPN